MHFWCAKFLARKNGRVNFLTNLKSVATIIFIYLQHNMIRLIDGDSYDHVVYVVSDDCTQCIRLVWIAFIIVGFEHNNPY